MKKIVKLKMDWRTKKIKLLELVSRQLLVRLWFWLSVIIGTLNVSYLFLQCKEQKKQGKN